MLQRARFEVIGFVGLCEVIAKNGKSHARINVATSRKYEKDGQTVDKTTWHRIVSFHPKAVEFAQKYVRKGMYMSVEGYLGASEYEVVEGKTIEVTDLIATRLNFLERKAGVPESVDVGDNSAGTDAGAGAMSALSQAA